MKRVNTNVILQAVWPLSFAAIAFFALLGSKVWLDFRTPYDDDAAVNRDCNMAVALRRAGWYLAFVLGVAGSLSSIPQNALGLRELATDAVAILALLGVAGIFVEKAILPKVHNTQAVAEGNIAVGLVEFGTYIAVGLILWASFSGTGGGALSAVVFSLIGLVVLWLYYFANGLVAKATVDIAKEIEEKGNIAAAVDVFVEFLALAIILAASIAGPFTGWLNDLRAFAVTAIFGCVGLLVLQKLVDWLFIPNVTIDDEVLKGNVATVVYAEAPMLSVAVIIAAYIAYFA